MAQSVKRRRWTNQELRELRAHSRNKTPVSRIAKTMRRSAGALRQKAFALRLALGHQR
jgi:hypothetical protein